MRQNDLAWEVRDYLKTHPNAAVVNLGCGLDSTGRSCDNGSCKIYNLDLPDVIAVRNELLPAGEREENIPCDLNNTEWFRKIDSSNGAVFFASGVFYYFLTEQVKALQAGWRERGISFTDGKARLISVVLHDKFSDTDNTLFIGHVGILLPAENGELYFIEKVAFQEPYRLVKLKNRTELSDYLMEKDDVAWEQDTTRPFIMENDNLLEGYRQNPLAQPTE